VRTILWTMLALAVSIGGAAAQTSAPALGDRPAAPRTAPLKKHADAGKLAALSPPELAIMAEDYENHGGYAAALEALLELHKRVKPDADLELEISLDEARTGHPEDAWKRLEGPLLTAAEHDSLPEARRHDYQHGRSRTWVNGRFDGWHWYVVRARAELGAALGHWNEARTAAEACVAARPLAGKEWLILAICAGQANDDPASRQAARAALELDPTLPEARYLEGLYAWRDGKRAEAQEHFRAAVALDSTYRDAATALVRCALPFSRPEALPSRLLTGKREAGLLTSPARPKREEFVQLDLPPTIEHQIVPAVPESMRKGLPKEMTLPILIDTDGRIVMHELPWFGTDQIPAALVPILLESLPQWRFAPGLRLKQPQPIWTAILLTLQG